ncbi:MAG TPA: MFS transporter [Xanthobacteraceae bacterium]|jgi:MFS family permease|nr:MFS transporter [Xanthobacteraceae bacterium]
MSSATLTSADPIARRNGFIGAFLGWLFDGYETYATVLIAAAAVNDLVGPGVARAQPLFIGGILATTLVAWAVGGLLSGILADYFGRRRVLLTSILWYSIFAGLTALAPNYVSLLVLRFLTGIGMGAEWGAGSSLVSELWDPQRRGRGLAYLQSGFGCGFLLAAAIWQVINQGGVDDWRWMYVIGVTPAIATLFVRRYVKDSNLWIEADQRRRLIRQRVNANEPVDGGERNLTRLTLWQLFETRELRRRVALLLIAGLSTTIGWWAVSAWIPQFTAQQLADKMRDVPGAITQVVITYNAIGILGFIAVGYLADWLGRKPTMIFYFIGSLISVPALFLWPTSLEGLTAAAAVNGFFTLGQWTWLAIYPSELFPTHIRATAITFVFNTTRLVAAVATLISAYLIQVFGSISTAAVVVGSIYVLGLLVTPWIGPETRAKPLPGLDDFAGITPHLPTVAAE